MSAPTLHRDCLVGANPIIWSNDDFNELAGDVPLAELSARIADAFRAEWASARGDAPLTTIAIPHQQIGAEAARMLLEAIADDSRPARTVQLPLSLVVRGSTAPPG